MVKSVRRKSRPTRHRRQLTGGTKTPIDSVERPGTLLSYFFVTPNRDGSILRIDYNDAKHSFYAAISTKGCKKVGVDSYQTNTFAIQILGDTVKFVERGSTNKLTLRLSSASTVLVKSWLDLACDGKAIPAGELDTHTISYAEYGNDLDHTFGVVLGNVVRCMWSSRTSFSAYADEPPDTLWLHKTELYKGEEYRYRNSEIRIRNHISGAAKIWEV